MALGAGLQAKAWIGRLVPGIGISSTQPFIHSLIHSIHSRNGLSDTRFCNFDSGPGSRALADASVSPSPLKSGVIVFCKRGYILCSSRDLFR